MSTNMSGKKELELALGQKVKFEPLFQSEQEYQAFCADFRAKVKPALDRRQEARRLSEEQAKRHLVY